MELDIIAQQLELLEETLIYRLLERVQFAEYAELYRGDSLKDILSNSLLGMRLRAHESMELQFGRYNVAEEFPFSPFIPPFVDSSMPPPLAEPLTSGSDIIRKSLLTDLKPLRFSPALKIGEYELQNLEADLPLPLHQLREISQCNNILQYYLGFLGRYCPRNDVPNTLPHYGSALEHDVMVLQAISRRVHYGAIYVAESKFREKERTLRPLILRWQQFTKAGQDFEAGELRELILTVITRPEIEQKILQRVCNKAKSIQFSKEQYIQAIETEATQSKIERYYLSPQAVQKLYAECVILFTKEGELAYLYRRI